MKGLLLIVGVILWVGASAERLDKETVRNLIDRVKTLNGIKRQMHTAKRGLSSAAACPLAKYHNKRWLIADPTSERISHDLFTARSILLEAGYSSDDLKVQEVRDEFRRQAGSDCDTTPECSGSIYRTADGSCNNVANPKWGSTGSPQGRLLDAAYFPGTTDPRNTSAADTLLSNPRTISNNVHKTVNGPNGRFRSSTINLQTFQMGQFLDHDVALTPTQTDVEDCCTATNRLDTTNCIPIIFSKSSTETGFFRGPPSEEVCMNVHRSLPQPCEAADGSREPMNNITSFIDCSNVYGSTDEEQASLRDGAFMKVDNVYWLPKDTSSAGCELDGETGQHCNLAGDHRVNVVPSLTAYHTLFALEHNRIATELQSEYPNDPETLFQETRRIVIAVMQKIVYGEFLPSFLSDAAMEEYDLKNTEAYVYDATIDSTISNEFAIAYRFGHTWIPRTMDRFNDSFRPDEGIRTRASYSNMTMAYFGYTGATSTTQAADVGPSQLAYWLTGEMSAETDRIVEEEARSFLFQNETEETAFDLVALNIQRGRDHGLQPYTKYRELCGLGTVTTFADLSDHTSTLQTMLAIAYDDPNDIDLFTGTMTEGDQEGSLGRTLECLLGKQFNALKYGDRFWYQGTAAGFTTDQLTAIDAYSMAGVLCNNFGYIRVDTPNAFIRSDRKGRCSDDVTTLNLDAFKTSTTRKNQDAPSDRSKSKLGDSSRKGLEDILAEKELQTVEELLEQKLLERLGEK